MVQLTLLGREKRGFGPPPDASTFFSHQKYMIPIAERVRTYVSSEKILCVDKL